MKVPSIKKSDRPEMLPLDRGAVFQTLQVSAKAGMIMPLHHTTKEAVIVVKKGSGLIRMESGNQLIKAGDSVIFPAFLDHSLEIKEDFMAVVVMATDGKIEFPQ